MHAIIPTDTLATYLDHIDPIAHEFKLNFDEDGFTTRVVDPSNVAFAALDLPKKKTESFEENGGGTLGINRDRLADVVSLADSNDGLLEVELNPETRKLDARAGGLSFTIGLIDPDSVRQEPDLPDLEEQWDAELTLPAKDLQQACKAIDLVSDNVSLEADPESEEVHFVGEGDTDDVTQRYTEADVTALSTDADCRSLFSLGYLQPIAKSFNRSVQVTIKFGQEVPCSIVGAGESGRVEYMLAPRIES